MRAVSYCLADSIDLVALERNIRDRPEFTTLKHWGCIQIISSIPREICYVFSNGALVSWSIRRHQLKKYLNLIMPFCVDPLKKPVSDQFSYQIGEFTSIKPHDWFNVDCITLESGDDALKLSLSYGLSHSVKLQYFELLLDVHISTNLPLIRETSPARMGGLSRKKIKAIIAEIINTKSKINLTSNFLIQPKYFWQHQVYESEYMSVANYLDVSSRAESINQRLNVMYEIFDMFNSQLESQRSHNLELIIIVLIAIEITFNFLNFHF